MALNNATLGNCRHDEERTQPEIDRVPMKEVMHELLLELQQPSMAEGEK